MSTKLIFNKLQTDADTIAISFDSGASYTKYDVATLKETMSLVVGDSIDISTIRIKGDFTKVGDVDVIIATDISMNPYDVIRKEFVSTLPETPIKNILYIIENKGTYIWNSDTSAWVQLNPFSLSTTTSNGDAIYAVYNADTSILSISANYATIDDFDLTFVGK